ncbi:hypothetical protein WL1483_1565 [Aeromonas schubertii]|uniref:Uncharacterized protein n=1 Tax=Aeromonas schubertii TaxID=652 RepID=A0A0S2SGY9_9GAMM|nr:hypothetical protein WL1483_1565 [Aeromonas schubertii]
MVGSNASYWFASALYTQSFQYPNPFRR